MRSCSAFEQDECTGSCAYDMFMLPGCEEGEEGEERKKFRKLLQEGGLSCSVSEISRNYPTLTLRIFVKA